MSHVPVHLLDAPVPRELDPDRSSCVLCKEIRDFFRAMTFRIMLYMSESISTSALTFCGSWFQLSHFCFIILRTCASYNQFVRRRWATLMAPDMPDNLNYRPLQTGAHQGTCPFRLSAREVTFSRRRHRVLHTILGLSTAVSLFHVSFPPQVVESRTTILRPPRGCVKSVTDPHCSR
jgi:hypothetical protein